MRQPLTAIAPFGIMGAKSEYGGDCIIGGIGLPSFYRATVNCPGYSLKVYLRVPRENFAVRSEWYRHFSATPEG